jgi:hypothetical protein
VTHVAMDDAGSAQPAPLRRRLPCRMAKHEIEQQLPDPRRSLGWICGLSGWLSHTILLQAEEVAACDLWHVGIFT